MSIQSSVNALLGQIGGAVQNTPQFESKQQQIGKLKQQMWQQKGQIARMKKARERLMERQQVLKQQAQQFKERGNSISIGGIPVEPTSPLYAKIESALKGGNNVKK